MVTINGAGIDIGNRIRLMRLQLRIYTTTQVLIFGNSLKIAKAFRRVQFERIFKYHE